MHHASQRSWVGQTPWETFWLQIHSLYKRHPEAAATAVIAVVAVTVVPEVAGVVAAAIPVAATEEEAGAAEALVDDGRVTT